MARKCPSLLMLIVAGLAGQVAAQSLVPINPGGVSDGHIYLFENAGGGTLPDESANSLDGTAVGAPQTAAGLSGEALQFNGSSDGINIPDSQYINVTGGPFATRTAIAIFNCEDVAKSTKQVIFEEGGNTRGSCFYIHEGRVYAAAWNRAEYNWNGEWLSAPIGSNEWHVIAMVIRNGGESVTDNVFEMWLDGRLIAKAPGGHIHNHSDNNAIGYARQNTVFHDGNAGSDGHYFQGLIDEVWILNQALSEDMMGSIGLTQTTASAPSPASGATDLPYYSDALSWTAGDFAAKHNVYLGTNFDDVNEASTDDPRGVLLGEGRTDPAMVIPEPLALEMTYYWRVDEVNSPPDSTIFTGDIWDFTVEPVAYEIANVTATASSMNDEFVIPENTVNGSGLTNGQHDSNMQNMWLNSATEPTGAWIQYNLGQMYLLNRAHVWNHNSQTESVLGYGIKEALIETSPDGESWTELKTVTIDQATGLDNYAGVEVALDDVTAQYVRFNALSNHSILGLMQSGLAEIRFYYIPTASREFSPIRGTDTAGLDVSLSWRSGRYADEHKVLVSTDRGAVEDGRAVIATTPDRNVALSSLEHGQLNYWQVIDVAADGTEYPSDIMYFYATQNGLIDDMESYQAEEGLFIWEHWIDGFEDNANGSIVGNGDDAEKAIVYEGGQSLPVAYDNTAAALSEATLYFDTAQDLTAGNPESLKVQVRGDAPGFVEDPNGAMILGAAGADIWDTADDFRFVYKRLSGDGSITARVNSAIDVHEWVKAGVMIRESLSADATNAYSFATPRGRVGTQWRVDAFGATVSTRSLNNGAIALPYWVRITRTGNMFKGEQSVDGVTWLPMIREDIPDDPTEREILMIPDVYIGLAVTSHVTGTATIAVLSDVTTTGSVTGPWISEALGADTHPDNDAAPMYLRLADTAGKEKTFDHPDAAATIMTAWDEWTLPMSDLSPVNPARLDSITIGVGGSGVTGKVYVDAIRVNRPPTLAPLEEVSSEALIAQYAFEDGAADSTGKHPGELFGNATITPDGKAGQGLNLVVAPDANGTDVGSWVAIDNLIYQGTGMPAVSVTAWVRAALETNQIIVSFDRNEYWRLEINGDGAGPGQVGWDVMTEAGQLDYGSVTRVDDGEWHHLAGVFDRGSSRVFIDGLPEPATALGSTMGSGNLRYGFIGVGSEADVYNGPQNGTPNYFVGDVDDVRIYHRALSPGEAASLASE